MPVGMFLSSLDQSPRCIWYRAHGKWFQIDGKTYVSGNLDVMAIFFATFPPLNSIKDKITLSADRKLEWPFCPLMHKRIFLSVTIGSCFHVVSQFEAH